MCKHQPQCPDALASDRIAACAMARHPEQGWSLLCNGVVLFDDGGVLLPGGQEEAVPAPVVPPLVVPALIVPAVAVPAVAAAA